jgi:putative heme-binding domain-containing protein
MTGFLEAFAGREIAEVPDELARAIATFQAARGTPDAVLALKLGQADAVGKALQLVAQESADPPTRLAVIDALGQTAPHEALPVLLRLLDSRAISIKRAALQALMHFDDQQVGDTICSRWHSSLPDEQDLHGVALQVLASRKSWAKSLLREIEESRIKPQVVPLEVVQQIRLHGDQELDQLIDRFWGKTRPTPEEKRAQIDRLAALIRGTAAKGEGKAKPDLAKGRVLFQKNCGVCHTLFDEGGRTGPNLTGYERDNLDFLLVAVVDPSAAIREEFTQFAIATKDGRILNGLIDLQTPTTITLRGANNQTTLINRDDIEELQGLRTSIMPDGVTEKLTDGELRDLFAFVMNRTPPAERPSP